MSEPTLYVKTGCPWCAAAMKYLDENGVKYQKVDVIEDPKRMGDLHKISGQSKTPTLVWNDEVLADFDVEQLPEFLKKVQG